MRRFFTFMMTLSLITAVSMPVSTVSSFAETATQTSVSEATETSEAAESVTDEASSEDSASSEDTSDEDDTSKPSVISSENDSSPDNPIGDNSSYYKVGKFEGAPTVSAESALLMDASTGAVLYGLEPDTRRYPASITKVMTALLVVENCKMDDIVTFSNEAVNGIEAGSSSAGINVGAELTVEDTLHAMMLVSANEAAAALAEHVAGSIDDFAKMMTERAKELGCTDTNFTNPHGLPDEKHYTTAHDMALILRQAMKYEDFRKVAETISYTLEKSDTLTNTLELWNHSKIIRKNSEYYYEYAEGSKPGFTQAALNTLVTYAKKDDTELLCVILKDYGAESSYHDTTALFEWGFDKVQGITPLSDVSFDSLLTSSKDLDDSKKSSIRSLKTSFNKDYYILVPKDFDTSSLATAFESDEKSEDKRLGYITISSGDTVIGKTPVFYEGTTGSKDATKPVAGDEDGLETAPNSDTSLKPHKLLEYALRVIIALILIIVIMGFIRKRVSKKDASKDFGRRNKGRRR